MSFHAWFAYTLLTFAAAGTLLQSTPFTWGADIVKPPRWPKGSTINVYIQKDPKDLGRAELLKEGVERWKQKMADRGVTVNVSVGDPPANTENVVKYEWADDGTKSEDGQHELGEGKDDAFAGPTMSQDTGPDGKPIAGTEKLTGGDAKVRKDLPSGTEAEKGFIRNLGEHEMTHVLGLADDAKGSVTKHEQPTGARTFNDQDKKELNSLYATATTGGNGQSSAQVTPGGGGTALGYLDYSFVFQPGNVEPMEDDPEHVALITFGIDPMLVTAMDLPPGWIALIAHGPLDPSEPYFLESNIDGFVHPSPFGISNQPRFLAMQTSAAEALRDGLDPQTDPGLSLVNPQMLVRIHLTERARMGEMEVWAGGDLQRVPGPVEVPEPAAGWLIAAAGAAMAACRSRKPNA